MGCCLSAPVDFEGEVNLYHFDLHRVVGKGAFGKVSICPSPLAYGAPASRSLVGCRKAVRRHWVVAAGCRVRLPLFLLSVEYFLLPLGRLPIIRLRLFQCSELQI